MEVELIIRVSQVASQLHHILTNVHALLKSVISFNIGAKCMPVLIHLELLSQLKEKKTNYLWSNLK